MHKLHDPSRPLGPDNPPMGYRLAEVGERVAGNYVWINIENNIWEPGLCSGRVGDLTIGYHGGPVALPVEIAPDHSPDAAPHISSPLYQSILDQIDAHDSATRGERADRVYAEAMRMIGGGA
jgi:hypothetical protein